MFGGSGKRGFARTRISSTEQAISWLLLVVLGGVGLAVYWAGQHYDPSLFGLNASQLSTEAQDRSEVARTEVALTSVDDGAPVGSDAAGGVGAALLDAAPDGWQALGALERFDADNLYEKINGRAEQYLAYDVAGLTCLSLAPHGGTGEFIDVFVYDMGAVTGAFGIYSIERSPEEPAADLGRGGYRAGASYFFWHGSYYIQVMASEASHDLASAGQAIATRLVSRLPDSGEPVAGLELLPRHNLVTGTEQYFMRDALSLEFLTDTFVGQYEIANSEATSSEVTGSEVTGFVSLLASPAAADTALEQYRAYLADFGEARQEERHGARWLFGDLGGFYDVVFRSGSTVAGVTLVEDADLADHAAEIMWRELSDPRPSASPGNAAVNQ